MATEPISRVPKVKHAVNAAHLTHQADAQHEARNISVEIKTTLVLVVGPSRKAFGIARDHLVVGAQ